MNPLNQTADPQTEWLYHAPPVGLVLGPNVIREEDLIPPRQSAVDSAAVEVLLRDGEEGSALADHWTFFATVLEWEARYVAGAPGGPELPANLTVSIPEHEVVLAPDWAVRDLGPPDGFQILVKIHSNEEADKRGVLAGWEATPHQQLERLLRETGVTVGVLVDREHIRIVYAPRGETSGWQTFPIRSLATVAGRAMLGGLKLMLGHARLFTEPENRRLPKLLAHSREAQNRVSAALAEQVLGALHELLRAFHTADNEGIERLVAANPHHLYEGLLTTLMRLVFLLYAEDRELMPTKRTTEGVEIYEQSYSVRGLYARLAQDRALNPDTMDERVGGWGQLLALFRLVHGGHRSGWITARGGKLFDPNEFPFLEGRNGGQPLNDAKVLPIRDGAILRILEGLMTLEARSISGEYVRERLSYRSLDVEQIGSVYETVMGFTVMRATSPMIAVKGEKNLPVFVEIEALASKTGADRQQLLKEAGVVPSAKRLEAIKKSDGIDELKTALAAFVDERGSPSGHVAQVGAPILQPTDERRRSGSHYTPRSLTEPIVRYTLEPAFKRIGDLATPDQVLEIKVCDPACGSGAFLVEVSRQLGARLEKAWGHHKDLKPAIPSDEEDDVHARRLVAQRCLYGVDKNPMAVDLARLSLWLATLAREHEFTFLDHAIKCGDSLVGLTTDQIQAVNWDTSKPGLPLLRGLVKERVNEVVTGRREIQFASDDVKRAIQEARHKTVEKRLEQPRTYGNAVVAAFFFADKAKTRETKRAEVESLLVSGGVPHWAKIEAIASTLNLGEHPITPFHWELEFPEIFARGNSGFDAIVGNPPFLGGKRISSSLGEQYLAFIGVVAEVQSKNVDLCGYFHLRAAGLLREAGCYGLIATDRLLTGESKVECVDRLALHNGNFYKTEQGLPWPGEASVHYCVLHFVVSSQRVFQATQIQPKKLVANAGHSFVGVAIQGKGFVLESTDEGLASDQRYLDVIRPFLIADDLNDTPSSTPRRDIIFFADRSLNEAEDYPKALDVVRARVKPYRDGVKRKAHRVYWWRYGDWRPGLFGKLRGQSRTLVVGMTSKYLVFNFVPASYVFDQTTAVVISESNACFGLLSSRVHFLWALRWGAAMGETPRYNPTRCFQTYPFPPQLELDASLEAMGAAYYNHRAALMIARSEGMTKTYNRFHDVNENSADIVRLRALHADMDCAVLRAYGWDDLADSVVARFLNEQTEDDHAYQGRLFWPSEFRDEVLARLLKLNAGRHEEEVRLGLAKRDASLALEPEEEMAEDAE